MIVDRRRIAKAAHGLLTTARHRNRPAKPRGGTPRRRTATGRDRQGAVARRADPDDGRADFRAVRRRSATTLFKLVRQLAAAGVAIIFTSHRIDEVVALADRVTVLRDGRHVLTSPIERLSADAIISAMVGRNIVLTNRDYVATEGAPVLVGAQSHARHRQPARLAARASGRELRPAARRNPRESAGCSDRAAPRSSSRSSAPRAAGEAAKSRSTASLRPINSPADACKFGVALVTEDRKARGLHLARRAYATMSPFLRSARCRASAFAPSSGEAALAADVVERLSVRCNDVEQIVCDPVGRQPAEGRHRQVAGDRASGPAARRADPRHRRRGEAGDLPAHLRAGGARARHRGREFGNAGAAAAVGPGSGHVRRASDRPSRRVGGDAGGDHAACRAGSGRDPAR